VSDDVRQALLALGYNERETTEALRQLPADLPVGEAIRQALRSLSRT
jgi:Holliday junction DNA helicase RuvA